MNLKILFLLMTYYGIFSIFFILGGSVRTSDGFNTSINFNASNIEESEIDLRPSVWDSGISFSRFSKLVAFGVGLPSDTPFFFKTIFFLWQTILTVFTIGFIIDSIWSG